MPDYSNPQERINELERLVDNLQKENEILKYQIGPQVQGGSKKGKKRFVGSGRILGAAFLGRGFRKSLLNLYDEIPSRQVKRETLANVTAHALWRFTRIGIFAILVALIPAVMVIMQTVLMNRQNRMIKEQFAQQVTMAERSFSLMETQNELLSRELDDAQASEKERILRNRLDDLKRDIRSEGSQSRRANLSAGLKNEIARFTGLDSELDAKEYGNGKSVIVSSAKGELLTALLVQELSDATYDAVYASANFGRADLQQANLDDAYLQRVPFEGAFLLSATFRAANAKFANFKNAILEGCVFSNAELNRASFNNADAKNSIFIKANLRNADLGQANFSGADLREVVISGANMENTNLEGVKVGSASWLNELQSEEVAGLQTILSKFRVNPQEQKDEYDRAYYLIERR